MALYPKIIKCHWEHSLCAKFDAFLTKCTKHYILDQQNIEKIQRRATRTLAGLQDTPYTERLRILGLPSLQYRRLRDDMILLYRLVNNDIGIDFSELFTISSVTSTRGHMYKLYKPHATTRARCHFFQ